MKKVNLRIKHGNLFMKITCHFILNFLGTIFYIVRFTRNIFSPFYFFHWYAKKMGTKVGLGLYLGRKFNVKFCKIGKFLFLLSKNGRLASFSPLLPLHEYKEMLIIKHLLRNNLNSGIFIDIGAHIGKYSIFLSEYFNKIISIEPDKNNFNILSKNVKINRLENKILPINIAILDREKVVWFFEYEDSVKSSIKSNENEIPTNKYKIRSMPLDKLTEKLDINAEKIRLIKIDVGGAEFEVIKGAIKTLKNSKPILLIEVKKNEFKILKLLKHLGYKELGREGENHILIKA